MPGTHNHRKESATVMHPKMQYLNDRVDERERLKAAWARRDRSHRGKETALKVWSRQGNRRNRREERQDILDRRAEMDDRLWVEERTDGVLPTYRWEAGYRGDDEQCLEFWQDTCSCDECGRYLPAGTVSMACGYDDRGYYVRNVAMPVAHVDHDGKPCMGGQQRATPGDLVFDIEDAVFHEMQLRAEARPMGHYDGCGIPGCCP